MFGNGPRLVNSDGTLRKPVTEATTPELVNAYADMRVWFAVHEVTAPTVEGGNRHNRHCEIVTELRVRGALD